MTGSIGSWARFKHATKEIEGFFSDLASCASDAILRFQAELGVQGDLLEIGAWHGKSASLWLVHCRANEVVHVVDYECRDPLRENLERVAAEFGGNLNLVKNTSFRFPDAAFEIEHRRALRLIHIDGDHSSAGVSNDLRVCSGMLGLFGVLIVDDFLNARFPQVSEAVFAFLAANRRDFAMFACGSNKAFIGTAKAFDQWSDFAHSRLVEEVKAQIPGLITYDGSTEGRRVLSLR